MSVQICIVKCLWSNRYALPEKFGRTIAQECKNFTCGRRTVFFYFSSLFWDETFWVLKQHNYMKKPTVPRQETNQFWVLYHREYRCFAESRYALYLSGSPDLRLSLTLLHENEKSLISRIFFIAFLQRKGKSNFGFSTIRNIVAF